jgi:hypothetical protein
MLNLLLTIGHPTKYLGDAVSRVRCGELAFKHPYIVI